MKLANGARTPRPREPIQPEHADEASVLLHESSLPRDEENGNGRNPVGVVDAGRGVPRVARSSQPWAGGRNPFGIEDGCEEPCQCPSSTPQLLPKLPALFALLLLTTLLGCSRTKPETPQQRAEAAKALFERTTKTFHIPSAETKGAEKDTLQGQAAAGYEQLLKKYPDQDYWAAQALHNLGNIRAIQGKIDEAVTHYANVEKKYPQQRWEVLMSWKSAADLLWESGRHDKAKPVYQKIVAQYDLPESSQVEKTIVRGSKMRLAGRDLPAGN